MAKMYGPAGSRSARKAARAARLANLRRAREAQYGKGLPASSTGRAGGQAYWKTREPKTRQGANYTTIVITDPKDKNRARPFVRGKRGGLYPQKKWDSTKSVLAALPAAALLTTGVAYVGMRLKENAQITEWATWYPGGYTGMALTVGAAGAYVAYRNRHVLGLLVGLGIGFYALIKLALARISGATETPALETSPYAQGESTPGAGIPEESGKKQPKVSAEPSETPKKPVAGSALDQAVAFAKAGNLDFNKGAFSAAATNFSKAFDRTPDPLFKYNNARALEKLGDQQEEKNPSAMSQSGIPLWAANKLAALRGYDAFISMPGASSQTATLDQIKDLKAKAKTFRKGIFDELIAAGHLEETPGESAEAVEGVMISGDDDMYEVVEGDDDGEEVEGDEYEEVEGADDPDDENIDGDDEYEVVEGEEVGEEEEEEVGTEVYTD